MIDIEITKFESLENGANIKRVTLWRKFIKRPYTMRVDYSLLFFFGRPNFGRDAIFAPSLMTAGCALFQCMVSERGVPSAKYPTLTCMHDSLSRFSIK